MRVTHVITRLVVGGAQENTVSSVLGLREKPGLEVDLISGPSLGPEGSLEPALRTIPGLLTTLPELVRPLHPWKDFVALQKLTRRFQETRPDIVHTHSGKAGILGRFAAQRAQVPVIIHTIHGPSFGAFQGALPNFIYRTAEKIASRSTHHFVVVAKAMTEQYLAAGIGHPEQYSRVFSGFNLTPFLEAKNDLALRQQLGLTPNDIVVGKIARLFELKGHDDVFACARELVAKQPRLKFLFVGGGEWRERFGSMAKDLGLEKHFVFTGLVPPTEVYRYVGIMDILIHLSRREGLPRALPQAMAAGKPVIAYDCDGAREVCLEDETGFLLPAGDQPGLIEKILLLSNDPALREQLGSQGKKLAATNFPVERMVDDLHKLYLRLTAERGVTTKRA